MSSAFENMFTRNEAIDEKSFVFLIKALERNNLPGFDYIEFKQAMQALQALQIDTTTAIRSAFATASTVGLTRDKLLETAEHYQKILMQEKAQFDQALEKQVMERIETRRTETRKLQEKIAQYKEQIRKLEAEINAHQQKIDDTDKDIREAETRIESSHQRFDSTFQEILKQIKADLELINQHI